MMMIVGTCEICAILHTDGSLANLVMPIYHGVKLDRAYDSNRVLFSAFVREYENVGHTKT